MGGGTRIFGVVKGGGPVFFSGQKWGLEFFEGPRGGPKFLPSYIIQGMFAPPAQSLYHSS